jgi:hypothetical protein
MTNKSQLFHDVQISPQTNPSPLLVETETMNENHYLFQIIEREVDIKAF